MRTEGAAAHEAGRTPLGGGEVEVVAVTPRGYCYGVVDALALIRRVAGDPNVPRPIYVLGMIVHNGHVVDELAHLGVRTLDGGDRASLLERVDGGTVVFTAHGVSPEVKRLARERGLTCFDATCPDVQRTHDLIRERVAAGYEIVYVGRRGHPEPEGAIGEAPGHVHLVESPEDAAGLNLPADVPVAVTTQTTLSQWDTRSVIDAVLRRYPHAEVHNDICLATQVRQQAVADQAGAADVVLVVGDRRSNNSGRLAQVAREIAGRPAYLIDSVADIRPEWLRGARRVAVTAGSSTPSQLTRQVLSFLAGYDPEKGGPPPAAADAIIKLPGR